MPGPEAKIQSKILKELKARGIWSVKIITANRNGCPDILACHNGQFIGIEVKSATGRLSVLQQIQLDRIEEAGGVAVVAKSWEDVLDIL